LIGTSFDDSIRILFEGFFTLGTNQKVQAAPFYELSQEDHIPQGHLPGSIDRFVDLSAVRQYLADFDSHTGRPFSDPKLQILVPLEGYCFGIRSERRLCEEVHLDLPYRWFCHLDPKDRVPERSTFSKQSQSQ
jgi:transposase